MRVYLFLWLCIHARSRWYVCGDLEMIQNAWCLRSCCIINTRTALVSLSVQHWISFDQTNNAVVYNCAR